MELISGGVLTPFEATFIDTGLFVQAWIYDLTSGTPVGPTKVAMNEVTTGTYYGTYTPDNGKTYLIVKRVFTDGTYATVDTSYTPSSETVQVNGLSSGGSSTACGIFVTLLASSLVVLLEESEIAVSIESN